MKKSNNYTPRVVAGSLLHKFIILLALFSFPITLFAGSAELSRIDGENQAGIPSPDSRFTDNGDGTVTDNRTGLMWTKNANMPETYKTWQEALDYIVGMNAGSHDNFGYTDWRLPDINELENLIDAEKSRPASALSQPFNDVLGPYCWSSTCYAHISNEAWTLFTNAGYMLAADKPGYYYVWPVRSGQIISSAR